MSMKLLSTEYKLVGEWVLKEDGTVEGNDICKRIEWLTDSYLDLVQVDGDNWTALYRNPDDGEYWELTYPQSEVHGAGPPALKKLEEKIANKKYRVLPE